MRAAMTGSERANGHERPGLRAAAHVQDRARHAGVQPAGPERAQAPPAIRSVRSFALLILADALVLPLLTLAFAVPGAIAAVALCLCGNLATGVLLAPPARRRRELADPSLWVAALAAWAFSLALGIPLAAAALSLRGAS